jgi:hypothetical protein
LVTGLPLEQALSVVIAEDGLVEANYKDPKDPRKKGERCVVGYGNT